MVLTCRKKSWPGEETGNARRTEYHALSSNEDVAARAEDTSCSLLPEDDQDLRRGLRLKRDVGLFSCITFLLGSIIGTGIFITPGNVLRNSKSISVDLLMWTLGGANAFIGGLCAAELGALLPSSGGDYVFLLAAGRPYGAYGDVPAFLLAWTLFFLDPAGMTIQGLTFSAYILSLPYPNCVPPYEVKVLVTSLFITFATAVNCFSVKTSTKVQDVLSGLKCFFLYAVIVTGAVYSFHGNHMWDPQPSSDRPSTGDLASAMYSALYCYGGWYSINCIAEEVKNPGRNIPIAIAVSIAITVIIYILTNLAFFVVLDGDTIANTDAVAVTFVRATWGPGMAAVVPLVIAVTVLGTTCANVVSSSRLFFAASRQGHLARVMSCVHVDSSVPLVAMVVRCFLSVAFALAGSVHFLIEVSILLGNFIDAASVVTLFLLRRSMPDAPRPFRVPTVIALLRLVVCLSLAAMTLVQVRRYAYQYALLAAAFTTGAVYYYFFVKKRFGLHCFEEGAVILQKCFNSAPCSREHSNHATELEWN
uniref:Putative amino acid transporter n=1 Tax=Hyalomma excavatum TaxID=257692 RepID=A0A131XGF2_9ACAR